MWSRALIKTETLDKYRKYAKKNGFKLWFVFDKAFECMIREEESGL